MTAALLSVALAVSVSVPDLGGKPVQVLPSPAKRGVVVFFVVTGCPIANGYVPEMNRIAKAYEPKGWKFNVVYVDSFYSPEGLRKHYKEFGYIFPALNDSSRTLVKLAGATKTPEAAVFSSSGTLLYDGRIDDRYYALGKQRPQAQVHDLRNALDAIQAGKPVPHRHTEVIGCYMPMD